MSLSLQPLKSSLYLLSQINKNYIKLRSPSTTENYELVFPNKLEEGYFYNSGSGILEFKKPNEFNQDLNTTSNVRFHNLIIDNKINGVDLTKLNKVFNIKID
jgi:hypothetical protein